LIDYITNKAGQKRPYGFKYAPKTGMLYRSRKHVKNTTGKLGPIYNKNVAYQMILYKKEGLKVHRLAFLFMEKLLPFGREYVVDHINGKKHDNRWYNLRIVSKRENDQNKLMHRNGKLAGANQEKGYHSKRWVGQININGTRYGLGTYDTELEAHQAYLKALSDWSNNKKVPG
jgi:hypothetical protein